MAVPAIVSLGMLPWLPFSLSQRTIVKYIKKSVEKKRPTWADRHLKKNYSAGNRFVIRRVSLPHDTLFGESVKISGRILRVLSAVMGGSATIVSLLIWGLTQFVNVQPDYVVMILVVSSILILTFMAKTLIRYWTLEDVGIRFLDVQNQVMFSPGYLLVNSTTSAGLLLSVFSLSHSYLFVLTYVIAELLFIGSFCILAVVIFHFYVEDKLIKKLERSDEFCRYTESREALCN